mgnify:CR=1 FL=1
MPERMEAKTIKRISPVYEKELQPNGHGFIGFTIFYSDSDFSNYIRFFERDTHQQIIEQVTAIHAGYCQDCQLNNEKRRPLNNTPAETVRVNSSPVYDIFS